MWLETIQLTLKDIMAIIGFIIVIAGAVNGVVFALLRIRFIPRSFLFNPEDGTPLYRTIKDCDKMEQELKKERRERDARIEKTIQDKVDLIKSDNEQFVKSLESMFKTQTGQLVEAVIQGTSTG